MVYVLATPYQYLRGSITASLTSAYTNIREMLQFLLALIQILTADKSVIIEVNRKQQWFAHNKNHI